MMSLSPSRPVTSSSIHSSCSSGSRNSPRSPRSEEYTYAIPFWLVQRLQERKKQQSKTETISKSTITKRPTRSTRTKATASMTPTKRWLSKMRIRNTTPTKEQVDNTEKVSNKVSNEVSSSTQQKGERLIMNVSPDLDIGSDHSVTFGDSSSFCNSAISSNSNRHEDNNYGSNLIKSLDTTTSSTLPIEDLAEEKRRLTSSLRRMKRRLLLDIADDSYPNRYR
mmetsp:Transcript_12162/g.21378  ORF Transcript_12162/g.21378 Transcript_12162/m.21378 type:complete len:223 (-) Transcript_12162:234-902(-)